MVAWTRYEAGELIELLVPLSAAGHRGEDEPRRCRELAERLCKVAVQRAGGEVVQGGKTINNYETKYMQYENTFYDNSNDGYFIL
jgi:hypothetical protein